MILRTKFILIFLSTAIIPLVILTTLTYQTSRRTISKTAEEKIQNIAQFRASRTRVIVKVYTEQAKSTAAQPALSSLVDTFNKSRSNIARMQINDYLSTVKSALSESMSISVVDDQNSIVASSDSALIGTSAHSQPSTIDFIVLDNQPPRVSVNEPLQTHGAKVGTLQLINGSAQLTSLTEDHAGLGQTGDAVFVRGTSNNVIITNGRFQKNDPEQKTLHTQLTTAQISQALDRKSSASGVVSASSTSFLFALTYMPELHAGFLTKVDSSEVLKQVNKVRDNLLIFALMFVLLVVMVILFFVHTIVSPIASLAAVAQKISGGNSDLSDRALVVSNDEIGSLAMGFNHMLDELQNAKTGLEDKIHERTKQLEMSNKELESFSYSVSHDLRAPLRSIDGFSNILTEDYADKLDEEGKHVIATIRKSTQQMGRLIDDLLAFSRMGRQEVKKQRVDMARLAQDVYDQLKLINPKRRIHLHINSKMPVANADASLMRQVWSNLLSNAIKFTRDRGSAAEIEVGFTSEARSITYFVRDNGAGFDMAYVDKLFGVFQRLHDQKDFEGTGVGLAIIKRIVERHGGTVRAEGEVDKGATISFTLPTVHNKAHKKKGKTS